MTADAHPRTRVVCDHQGTRSAGRPEDFIVELEDARAGSAAEIVVTGRPNSPSGWTIVNFGRLAAELREHGPRGVTASRKGLRNGRTLALPCRRCSRSPVVSERRLGEVLDGLYQVVEPDPVTGIRTVTVRLIETALRML